jgi:hypothetical protein
MTRIWIQKPGAVSQFYRADLSTNWKIWSKYFPAEREL